MNWREGAQALVIPSPELGLSSKEGGEREGAGDD
jgi:hypothetical protein